MEKILTFEYFVNQLIRWQKTEKNGITINDFSTLKVLKLLFFCSAINATKESTDSLLDSPFNNFFAMPYGHVESDIYHAIRTNTLQYYSINNVNTTEKNIPNFSKLNADIKLKIDLSLKSLKEENPTILEMNSFELVELSHLWYSWKFYFDRAKQNGVYSTSIPIDVLKSEEKYFLLN